MQGWRWKSFPWSFFVLLGVALAGCGKSGETDKNSGTPDAPKGAQSSGPDRLAWNRETLTASYEKVGEKNAAWDEAAKDALSEFAEIRFAKPEDFEAARGSIVRYCNRARSAGCTDPMIEYLYVRFDLSYQDGNDTECAQAMAKAAQRLIGSQYPDIRKFYACLRAADQLKEIATNTPPEVHYFRRMAMGYITNVVADRRVPVVEIDEACSGLFGVLSRNKTQTEQFYKSIEKPLFSNWGNDYRPWLLKGRFYREYAWAARGGGYANTVTDEGWKLFKERLAIAADALEKAWKISPTDARIANEMIEVEVGQHKGRQRMETWFDRAMTLDTNNYQACQYKHHYLLPIWYGSREEMLGFGRECARSEKWGGRVPLVLVDAHDWLANTSRSKSGQDYWKNAEVWSDLKTAFEKFFQVNPNAIDYRHNYALYAYRCEQWEDLNRQIALLGPVNYGYFGGRAEFDKMVALAKQHSSTAREGNVNRK